MGSSSPPEGSLHDRVRQQEVVASLGQQAFETDDLDQSMDLATAAVADETDRIFELFQRRRTNDESAGGEIWVDSEPGEGATFSFTLPATGDADE